ncbi:MAG: glycosyltransferase family 61 protein [Planctomycetota bacterium]
MIQTFHATSLPIPHPLNGFTAAQAAFTVQTMHLPDAGISVVSDVVALGRGPLSAGGSYRKECFSQDDGAAAFRRRRKHWRLALERLVQSRCELREPTVWITDDWSFGYFHWMCDALPRLEMVAREFDLADLTLVLPHKATRFDFITESLKAFPLAGVRLLGRFQSARCREMVLPTHVATSGNYRPELMDAIRSRCWRHVEVKDRQPASERVFISRRNATRRRLINETDLRAVLVNHGIRIIETDRMAWADQVKLFATTRQLVSLHGAGLTNMLFMPPGGDVVEIRDPVEPTSNCYLTLAGVCGHRIAYVDSAKRDSRSTHHADVTIQPADLDRRLDELATAKAA